MNSQIVQGPSVHTPVCGKPALRGDIWAWKMKPNVALDRGQLCPRSSPGMSSLGCCLMTPVPDSFIIIWKKLDMLLAESWKTEWKRTHLRKQNFKIWGSNKIKKETRRGTKNGKYGMISVAGKTLLVSSNRKSNTKWFKREKEGYG